MCLICIEMEICHGEQDTCGNRVKDADSRLDLKGKSKVSSLAANLQKQFDRQQVILPRYPYEEKTDIKSDRKINKHRL